MNLRQASARRETKVVKLDLFSATSFKRGKSLKDVLVRAKL